MSDFTVLRSLDGYCLVLDKKRIAGGKPDYRGENVLVDWTTEVVYGPVDDLAAENAKLRELLARMARVLRADDEWSDPFYCNPYCADQFRCRSDDCVEVQCPIVAALRELGVVE